MDTAQYGVAPQSALVVGASGGIGGALVPALRERYPGISVTAWSRTPVATADHWSAVDLKDEASIAAAAALLGSVDLVIVATGLLSGTEPLVQPEKTWRGLDPAAMAEVFAINSIGPALIAKHVLPKLPRDRRAVVAALSARVGSIGDNQLGGWYAYRASKAALNQLIRTFSIELKVKWPLAVMVGLHPGTVATGLSRAFLPPAPSPRGAGKTVFLPAEAAIQLLHVLERLGPDASGGVFDWRGERVPD